MKPLFFTFFSFLAFTSFAQNLELGLNYGIGYNSTVKNTSPNNISLMPGPAPVAQAPAYSFKGMYTYRKWQFGVDVDYRSSTYKLVDYYGTVCVEFPPNMTPAQFTQYMNTPVFYRIANTSHYIPIKLFTNRKLTTGKFENYGGLSLGYIFLPSTSLPYTTKDSGPLNKNSFFGLTAGVQIGSTYFITKRFGINAEVDADYIKFNQGAFATSYTYTYPVTVGIRYKL